MHKDIHPLKDLLGPRGLKSTKERETILRELEGLQDHFNAEKLFLRLNRKGAKVSRPTIYRTLKLFQKYHFIEKLDIKKKCFYYEPISQKKEHGHRICERCGKIIDFQSKSIETLKSEMGKDKNFRLHNISVQVFGICRDCQMTSKDKN
jgi:Fur family ferric uptake transcriptional regulator